MQGASFYMAQAPAPAGRRAKFPPGIPYIVGNEAAERFSFYGMRAILFVYMTTLYLDFAPPERVSEAARVAAETRATEVVHLFNAGVYALPMIGAILADRLLGKYRVIFWISLIYCAGHAMLAVAGRSEWGMYLGLGLIAVGSGGIKPCVSANVGDQFTRENAHLVSSIYQIFYFSINFGSFFSTLLTPWLYHKYGPEVAFGVPGILMGVATLVFWLGRNQFVKAPPHPGGGLGALDFVNSVLLFLPFAIFAFFAHGHFESGGLEGGALVAAYFQYLARTYWPHFVLSAAAIALWVYLFRLRQRIKEDNGFVAVTLYAFLNQNRRKPGEGFFSVARDKFGEEAAEGPPAVLRIMLVFSMVSVFWALFDQHSSTWIKQAQSMNLVVSLPFAGAMFGENSGRLHLTASQIPALNPLFVMIVIPLLGFGVFGPLERRGLRISPLRKMTVGMFLASVSFVTVAILEIWIARAAAEGARVSILWQMIPYWIITVAEVLVSTTGLEFAYTQAPRAMKSTIMGFWLLCVTAGNLLVAFLAPLQQLSLERFFWVFAAMMAVAATIFGGLAYFYRGKTYLQVESGP